MLTAKETGVREVSLDQPEGNVIVPYLTLYAEKTVVQPGETITLYGALGIPQEYGDIDDNGIIDISELSQVAYRFGAREGDPRYDPRCDFNKDGFIDIYDISFVASRFGQTSANKKVEIQQLVGDNWVKIGEVTTSGSPPRNFEFQVIAPSEPTTLYFRAYFPGGEY